MNDRPSHGQLAHELTRRQAIKGFVGAVGGLALGSSKASAGAGAGAADGIFHTADSIHQERVFAAKPVRVYQALTDSEQFARVIKLSGALEAMHLPDKPAEIASEAGGAFALFGGFITGRQVELVPDLRIVQAWRAGDWPPGVYSIAKFELVDQGSSCKLVFDHTGFPNGEAESLASGWITHYWEPLAKVLDGPGNSLNP
jgi:activator of HSP90 ATPase